MRRPEQARDRRAGRVATLGLAGHLRRRWHLPAGPAAEPLEAAGLAELAPEIAAAAQAAKPQPPPRPSAAPRGPAAPRRAQAAGLANGFSHALQMDAAGASPRGAARRLTPEAPDGVPPGLAFRTRGSGQRIPLDAEDPGAAARLAGQTCSARPRNGAGGHRRASPARSPLQQPRHRSRSLSPPRPWRPPPWSRWAWWPQEAARPWWISSPGQVAAKLPSGESCCRPRRAWWRSLVLRPG